MRIVNRAGMMVGAAALATAATVVFVGPAAASVAVSGCPAGYQLLSVPTLTADGYHLPALIDDPNVDLGNPNSKAWNSQPGNGDGFVCGRPEGNRTTSFGGQLYLFVDNQLPASS
jgi:hypothetical protein